MSQVNSMGTKGADWSWLVPLSEGTSNVIQGIFGSGGKASSAPPPPPSIPWVPIAAIGGGALLLVMVMNKKRA